MYNRIHIIHTCGWNCQLTEIATHRKFCFDQSPREQHLNREKDIKDHLWFRIMVMDANGPPICQIMHMHRTKR
jgi:hypothetical protein